jgi:hypothetical protein
VPAKPDSPPPSTAIVLQSVLRVEGAVNVKVQLLGVCGPLMVLVPARLLMVQEKPLSSAAVPDALLPATELVDLSVTLPAQVTVTEEPKRLSVHVTPPELVKLRVPDTDLPSALVLPSKVDSGHLVLRPLPSSVRFELAEVALTAVFTGVMVAWAGTAATARMASAAMLSSRPRIA